MKKYCKFNLHLCQEQLRNVSVTIFVMFFVGRLILRELHFIYKNKLCMFLIVKAFATAYHSLILQYSSSKKENFNFWHVHTFRSVFVYSPPPKPEVILTNFFAEPIVLIVPITSRVNVGMVLRELLPTNPKFLTIFFQYFH